MMYLLLYVFGMFAFYAWDCFIGTGIKWNTWKMWSLFPLSYEIRDGYSSTPPLGLISFFWILALPFILALNIFFFLDKFKEKRLVKEERKEKIRIAVENKVNDFDKEVEAALEEEMKNWQTSAPLKMVR